MKKNYLALLVLSAIALASCGNDKESTTPSANPSTTPSVTDSATPSVSASDTQIVPPTETESETPSETPSDSTSETPIDGTITIAEALEIASAFPSGKVTNSETTYRVSGTVILVSADKTQVTISDGTNSLLVYGVSEADFSKSGLGYEVLFEGYVTRQYNVYEITSPTVISYTAATYSIDIDDSIANGMVTASAVSEIAWGTTVTFSVVPDENYKLSTFSVNGAEMEVVENSCEVVVESDLTVMAIFVSADTPDASVYTYTFAKDDLVLDGGEVKLANVTWTYTAATYLGYGNNKGIQIGSSGNPVTSYSISTSGITGTITKIIVNSSTASGGTAKLSISVGGSNYLDNADLTTTPTDYTGIGTASGEITISWANTAKAFYVNSITVYYIA